MEKKEFLFDSLSGLIGDIAWQVSKEGHEVRYYKQRRENYAESGTRDTYGDRIIRIYGDRIIRIA
jgi:hypothetical protein